MSLLFLEARQAPNAWVRGTCASAFALLPIGAFTFGSARMEAVDLEAISSPTWRVGVVQPNVPVGRISAEENLARLHKPSGAAQRDGAEVVIWPEAGAYPYRMSRPLPDDSTRGQSAIQVGFDRPTLFGVGTRGEGDVFGYNTFAHMGRDGRVVDSYDKMNRVPVGEMIPFVDPHWAHELIPWISHLNAGTSTRVFVVERPASGDAVRVGPLICYEDIIPTFARQVAAQPGGIEIFVNATIDAWYGYSAEPWEHLALAQFRAVEHRIPVIRSVSTGVSAVIDHAGRLQDHIPSRPVSARNLDEFPAEWMVADVRLPRNTSSRPTPFARFGYLLPWLCAGSGALLAVYWRDRLRARWFPADGDPE